MRLCEVCGGGGAHTHASKMTRGLHAEARRVTAVMRFEGPPGRERDAALAWSFELRYYFLRGVSDDAPPAVTYEDGVYTCTGPMVTTHPGDPSPVVQVNGGDAVDLDDVLAPGRVAYLRDAYGKRSGPRFDGGYGS